MSASQSVFLGSDAIALIDGDRGSNYPSKAELMARGDCLFLNASNVTSRGFAFDRCEFISSEKDSQLRKGKLRRNDLVLTTRGTVGNVAFYNKSVPYGNVRINSGMVIIRPDTARIDPLYLYMFLRSGLFSSQVKELTSGSAQPQLPIRDLRFIAVPTPQLTQQREIAAILGALDDKIEVNRKAAATLEEMARALYRSWFVDFDPVHAKAEGRAPAHMDAATAALFPDRFSEDGLPEGWAQKSIYEFASVRYGAPFASSKFNTKGEGRPLVRIRDLKQGVAGVWTTEVHKGEYLIQPGDTVVGMDGDFTPYTWINSEALMNQRVCCFSPLVTLNHGFVRYALPALLKAEAEAAVATTVIHLGKKDIDKFEVIAAPPEVMSAFGALLNPWIRKVVALGLENRTLAALRDSLLPRLMSGELRVGAAQDIIEEAL